MKKLFTKKGTKIALALGIILYLSSSLPAALLVICVWSYEANFEAWSYIISLLLFWLIGSVLFIAVISILLGFILNYFFEYRENIYNKETTA